MNYIPKIVTFFAFSYALSTVLNNAKFPKVDFKSFEDVVQNEIDSLKLNAIKLFNFEH